MMSLFLKIEATLYSLFNDCISYSDIRLTLYLF